MNKHTDQWLCPNKECTSYNPDSYASCYNCGTDRPLEPIYEYLQGLARHADTIGLLIQGSTLNMHQTATLAFIQGYLQAAQSYVNLAETNR